MVDPDFTWPQHGDEPDASHFAYAYGALARSAGYITDGLHFSNIDYAGTNVDVAQGRAVIQRDNMTTASSDIASQTFDNVGMVVGYNGNNVGLTDGTVNHLYLDANVSTDDSPVVVTQTSATKPSNASLKIGEIDTSSDTASEQWNLITADGTLTFPDVDALDAAATNFRAGTVLYDRGGNEHYEVS